MKRTRSVVSETYEEERPAVARVDAVHDTVTLPIIRCLQDKRYTCGPASLKIVLASLGVAMSESRLEELCKTTAQCGTRPQALSVALGQLGVAHDIVEPSSVSLLEESIRSLKLCIVDYQAWGRHGRDFHTMSTGHYSVAFGFQGDHFLLADPAKKTATTSASWGIRRMRKDLFEKRWRDRTRDGLETFRWMLRVPLFQSLAHGET